MTADLGQRTHDGDHPVGHVPWMRTREADAFDTLHRVHEFEQPGEVAARPVRRNVVIDDLSQ